MLNTWYVEWLKGLHVDSVVAVMQADQTLCPTVDRIARVTDLDFILRGEVGDLGSGGMVFSRKTGEERECVSSPRAEKFFLAPIPSESYDGVIREKDALWACYHIRQALPHADLEQLLGALKALRRAVPEEVL
jgi:hypothetical protein